MENARTARLSGLPSLREDPLIAEGPAGLTSSSDLFLELIGPHKLKLYNYIHKSLAFSEEAEDVYQETLLRALRYFPSYKTDKCFSTWLFAIAHNEIKKHRRHVRRVASWAHTEEMIAHVEHARPELVREVYKFAEGLKTKHRDVFFLFYDSGFSITEISRITGVRSGNIKFILYQARKVLRERFGEHYGKP